MAFETDPAQFACGAVQAIAAASVETLPPTSACNCAPLRLAPAKQACFRLASVSTVRGFDGSDVIVPNGDLISARVTNRTLADQKRRIVLPVQIAYGSDPEKVLELLHRIASDNPEVLASPAPEALLRNLGPNAIEFELRAWTESERGWMAVMSDLALATVQALREAEIQIALPQRDIKIGDLSDLRGALSGGIQENAEKKPDYSKL